MFQWELMVMEIGNICEFIKHLLVLFLHVLYRCKGRVFYKVTYNIYCPSITLEWVVCFMLMCLRTLFLVIFNIVSF